MTAGAGFGGGGTNLIVVSTALPAAASFAFARCLSRDSRSDAAFSRMNDAALALFDARLSETSCLPRRETACLRASSSPTSIVLMAFVTSAPHSSAALRTSALVTPASLANSYTLMPKPLTKYLCRALKNH